MRRLILAFTISLALVSTSSAYFYPVTPIGYPMRAVQRPVPGQVVFMYRPTWLGNTLFGPIWGFIPAAPGQAPAANRQMPMYQNPGIPAYQPIR